MTHKDHVYAFFKPIHNKIGNFATAPYSGWDINNNNLYEPAPTYQPKPIPSQDEWVEISKDAFTKEPYYQHQEDEAMARKAYEMDIAVKNSMVFFDVAIKVLLSPVLLPATLITMALALVAEVITGIAHLASLGVAAIADAINSVVTSTDSDLEMALLPR